MKEKLEIILKAIDEKKGEDILIYEFTIGRARHACGSYRRQS